MPEDSGGGGTSSPVGVLTKKVGPFKGYVWVGIVGVPIAAFILLRKKSTTSPANAGAVASGIPGYDPGAVAGGGGSGGGGSTGGNNPAAFDPAPLISAINANSTAQQQQFSSSFATLLGSITQMFASQRAAPTLTMPSTPTYTTTAAYTPPPVIQPQPAQTWQSIPASMPVGSGGYYQQNNPASWPVGVYSPGGGYAPLPTPGGQPLPGMERTTYFGGNGQIYRGGVPA